MPFFFGMITFKRCSEPSLNRKVDCHPQGEKMLFWLGVLLVPILLTFAFERLFAPGFNVKGRHVVITGGSSGLGLAFGIKVRKNRTVILISTFFPLMVPQTNLC